MYTSKFSVVYSIGNLQHKDTHLLFWSVSGTSSSIYGSPLYKNLIAEFSPKFLTWKIWYWPIERGFFFSMKKLTQICPRFQGISKKMVVLVLCTHHSDLPSWSQTHSNSNTPICQSPTKLSCLNLQVMDGISQSREREREREREWRREKETEKSSPLHHLSYNIYTNSSPHCKRSPLVLHVCSKFLLLLLH